jgi:hypothetical protein
LAPRSKPPPPANPPSSPRRPRSRTPLLLTFLLITLRSTLRPMKTRVTPRRVMPLHGARRCTRKFPAGLRTKGATTLSGIIPATLWSQHQLSRVVTWELLGPSILSPSQPTDQAVSGLPNCTKQPSTAPQVILYAAPPIPFYRRRPLTWPTRSSWALFRVRLPLAAPSAGTALCNKMTVTTLTT